MSWGMPFGRAIRRINPGEYACNEGVLEALSKEHVDGMFQWVDSRPITIGQNIDSVLKSVSHKEVSGVIKEQEELGPDKACQCYAGMHKIRLDWEKRQEFWNKDTSRPGQATATEDFIEI